MLPKIRSTPRQCIQSYIAAKDGNRPTLLNRAFARHAMVEMRVATSAIQFPSVIEGIDDIAQELVRNFAIRYEDIYTFCIGEPPTDSACEEFKCDWFVCMANKSDGGIRVGCGEYTWRFRADDDGSVEGLRITIEAMTELPANARTPIIEWAQSLDYPWCAGDKAVDGLRRSGLGEVAAFLSREP